MLLQHKHYCRDSPFFCFGRVRVRLFEDDGKPANSEIPDSELPSASLGFAVIINAFMCTLSACADFLPMSDFACYLHPVLVMIVEMAIM